MSRSLHPVIRSWIVVLTSALAATHAGDTSISYRDDVLPILSSRCFRCHGPDEEAREGSLRLDERASALAELDSGERAIVPGDLASSQIWQRITHEDPEMRMPPSHAGPRLNPDEQKTIAAWIRHGAAYQQHWSLELPLARPLPALATVAAKPYQSWPTNFVDYWTLDRMLAAGLTPQVPAGRDTLIRRVTLDLTGLPPTPAEVDQFVDDTRPGAYERVVDRLLASPAFGERWARPWLDLARYADSAGYAQDPPREIWRYRDWVVAALNQGMNFDQFTIEQLAGDLLSNPTEDQLIATAFHRNTMTNSEGGTDDEEFRSAAVVDRVNTTMQVWMGITMGCAQCHTHKYDPISQHEYYQMYAVFNNTADADRGDESPFLTELTDTERQEIARLESAIAKLQAAADDSSTASTSASSEESEKQLKALQDQRAAIQGIRTPIMRELPDDESRQTFIQIRGNFLVRGDQVEPGVPAVFPALPDGVAANRLSVSRWLVDAQNPLTPRVTVNRIWEHLFGVGLVETSEDFGSQGKRPSHPELLDQLSLYLIDTDWNLKGLMRLLVTSSTYRQSSRSSDAQLAVDPRNLLLSRGPSFRLPAEMIRDQSLAIGGLLSRKMYGPSVRPPRPRLGLRAAFGRSTDWETSEGEDRYRRGIYTRWRRTTPYPSMATFDAPSREVCTIRRIRTNTPLQAFVTLNDPAFVEAAVGLAQRMTALDGVTGPAPRIRYGFRLCVARQPADAELQRLVSLYHDVLSEYTNDPTAAKQLIQGNDVSDSEAARLAAYTVVANVLLNLDEVLTKK